MKKSIGILLIAAGFGIAALAQSHTIQHDEGTTIIPSTPKRVVAIDEEALGWLFALGVSDKIVGLGSARLEPADIVDGKVKPELLKTGFYNRGILANPTYVGSWIGSNLETILSLKPDLIVRLSWDGNKNYDNLSKIAPTLGYKESSANFWEKGIRDLGQVFNRSAQAKSMLTRVKNNNTINAGKLRKAGVFKKYPKVVVLSPFAGGTNYVYLKVRAIADLRAMGFKDGIVLDNTVLGISAPVSNETLVGLDKETLVVVYPPSGNADSANAFLASPVGQRLKDQSIVYVAEKFSPWSGPLVSIHNSNDLTKLILEQVK